MLLTGNLCTSERMHNQGKKSERFAHAHLVGQYTPETLARPLYSTFPSDLVDEAADSRLTKPKDDFLGFSRSLIIDNRRLPQR